MLKQLANYSKYTIKVQLFLVTFQSLFLPQVPSILSVKLNTHDVIVLA